VAGNLFQREQLLALNQDEAFLISFSRLDTHLVPWLRVERTGGLGHISGHAAS
jgi:hypothetical protein